MSDRLDKLRAALQELETELSALDSIDDETRAALADAAAEIAVILRRGQHKRPAPPVESSLQDRLVQFEASHPQLAGILSRVLDGLHQLGI
jgi:hypothetical protein